MLNLVRKCGILVRAPQIRHVVCGGDARYVAISTVGRLRMGLLGNGPSHFSTARYASRLIVSLWPAVSRSTHSAVATDVVAVLLPELSEDQGR